MPDLLIELFSEEIPARMQTRAAEDLKKRMADGLVDAGLTYAGAAAFSTPRRLTLTIQGLLAASPTTREDRKGPKVDAPDKAVDGFLRGAGLTRDQLEQRDTPKGAVYFATIVKPGRPAADIVAEVLEITIRNFPWPKSMRWGSGSLRWVRPLQSILCILSDEAGAEVVPLAIDGITAGDTTQGHRFMAPDAFAVTSFEDYETRLKRAHVVLSASERAEHIWADATNMAFAAGLEVVEDSGLLAEVAGLVEWPVVLMGKIDAAFLDLPPEVLQTSMREHQKFFSVKNVKTGRIERFVTVANRETTDQGATILAGNEKVLTARLADAKFFWDNDLRVAKDDLSVWTKALDNVTFHNKLGSQGDRIERIATLARELAPIVGADPAQAEAAARLAKADLSSEMVYEFPELQGLMGRYYIEAAGHDVAIAAVAQDHYSPLGPSDDVPTAPLSVAVALADKIDTLTGFWAIGEKPTGSKDPFALRRAALGVIRLVLENELRFSLFANLMEILTKETFFSIGSNDLEYSLSLNPLDFVVALREFRVSTIFDRYALEAIGEETRLRIADLVEDAIHLGKVYEHHSDVADVLGPLSIEKKHLALDFFRVLELRKEGWDELPEEASAKLNNFSASVVSDLLSFLHDRLKVYLRDQGIRHDIIDACIAMPGNDDLTLLVKRARALNDVLKTEDGENLLQGFKRANNILTQAEDKDGVEYSFGADIKFAEDPSEKALFAALEQAETQIKPALEAQDFPAAMATMAALRAPIDAFFETVKINADSETLRRNRLNLLSQIRSTCLQVADLTRIEG